MDVNYSLSLDGKVALVTGAAAGIGKCIAEAYLSQGARVVLVDRNPEVTDIAASLGGKNAAGIVADLTRSDSLNDAVEQALEAFGGIDILVNSAGVVELQPAEAFSEENWDRTMSINLKSVFMMCQAVGRHMLERGQGRIINLASQAGLVALDQHLAYCASKAGVISLTKGLALEWSPRGINVNAISPTVVLTELGRKAWAGEVGEAMKQKIPTRRFAEPEEIAMAALYLAGNGSGMISGENLVIDGGYTAQ
ncbi:D-threitol dehydrogenase [Halomonas cupida]|uniref:D-threitol dehydrogenase n=1 Tax=Halomonas cupida TaxID=44933 RepID=A0A1M7FDP1_9GAMM|nr:D-threitol dehydrogenase [Halomonas cupida]GEN23513.1 D-threitol dehydrogenase [Halomonas cupida]SHM02212.1 NAD(P)-dependent dehydrogenase, short-chain alcohol dehydrogenase family [Halomonas cupida]